MRGIIPGVVAFLVAAVVWACAQEAPARQQVAVPGASCSGVAAASCSGSESCSGEAAATCAGSAPAKVRRLGFLQRWRMRRAAMMPRVYVVPVATSSGCGG